jgi:hypothetical protein
VTGRDSPPPGLCHSTQSANPPSSTIVSSTLFRSCGSSLDHCFRRSPPPIKPVAEDWPAATARTNSNDGYGRSLLRAPDAAPVSSLRSSSSATAAGDPGSLLRARLCLLLSPRFLPPPRSKFFLGVFWLCDWCSRGRGRRVGSGHGFGPRLGCSLCC